MARALELAERGCGAVSPNPVVGCVIVRDGEIIGEGWHAGPGSPHAETMALADAVDAAGSTVFVTLEPCNHIGRTPPCTEALIQARVSSVIYAIKDPNRLAAGGAQRLASANIRVEAGVCEHEALEMNRFWLHALTSSRPYTICKLAMSLDGRIAATSGESQWITGKPSRVVSHKLRKSVDAIMVGANTVKHDNPRLTARREDGSPFENKFQPLRVVVDSTGSVSPDAVVFTPAGCGALLATTDKINNVALREFEKRKIEVIRFPVCDDGRVDLAALTEHLRAINIHSLAVEGGGRLVGGFFSHKLADEFWAFIATDILIGDSEASAIVGNRCEKLDEAIRLAASSVTQIGKDMLIKAKVRSRCTPPASR